MKFATGRSKILSLAACVAWLAGCGIAAVADQALIDAATKEGEIVWCTSFVEHQLARPLAAAFAKKYPGIKVQIVPVPGTILQSMGPDKGMAYLRQLAAPKPVNVPSNQRVVLDQVIAGEYPLAVATFNTHSDLSAAKGAPVK